MNTEQVFKAAHGLTRRAIKSGAKGTYREVFAIMLRVAYRNELKLDKVLSVIDTYKAQKIECVPYFECDANDLLAMSYNNGALGGLSWLECFDVTVDCICNHKA